jgi:hypothetical protein
MLDVADMLTPSRGRELASRVHVYFPNHTRLAPAVCIQQELFCYMHGEGRGKETCNPEARTDFVEAHKLAWKASTSVHHSLGWEENSLVLPSACDEKCVDRSDENWSCMCVCVSGVCMWYCDKIKDEDGSVLAHSGFEV